MEGLDGMMGLIPTVVGAGVVMHITDRMMGPNSRYGNMQGEQDRYEEKKPMRRGMRYGSNTATRTARARGRRAGSMMRSGRTSPQGLSSMMRKEGSKVMQSVAYEGHKLGKGTLGSLPGVGKVTVGKLSDIGMGGNRMYKAAQGSMRARTLGKL